MSWLVFVFIAFGYFISQRLISFDPKAKLLNIDSASLSSVKTDDIQLSFADHKNTVFHLNTQTCSCNSLTTEHVTTIDSLAKHLGFQTKHITLSQSDLIPSTPAIMVIGDNGSLLYLGPYATGFACSTSNSLVETVLNNAKAGFNSNLIVSQAQGCYCNLQQS